MTSQVFPGNFASLEKIRGFFAKAAEKAGLSEKGVYEVQLAADEAASNIIDHAYNGENIGDIECSFEILQDGLKLILRDHGEAFDPEMILPPDVDCDPCARKPRGLGLYFMRKLMDVVEFTFNGDGGNILTMIKNKEKDI